MTPSLIVVGFGAIAAVAGTVVLARSCAKSPRIFLLSWTAAIFGLAVALAGQTIGDLAGYSGTIFRAMELGGQALAPLALCLALVELAGKSLPARFLMRLGVAAISVIVVAVLGTDPLNSAVGFSKRWPDPAIHYEFVPKYIIELLAGFTMLIAVGTAVFVIVRSLRGTERAELVQPTMATVAAAALVALPGIVMLAHLRVPAKDVFALALTLAAGTTWFAARAAEHRGLLEEPLRADSGPSAAYQRSGGGGYPGRGYQTGDLGRTRPPGRDDGRQASPAREPDLAYPGLAALAAGADEGAGGYRDRAGHDPRAGYGAVDMTGDYDRFGGPDPSSSPDSLGGLAQAGDGDSYPGVDQTGDHGLLGGPGRYLDDGPGGFGPGGFGPGGFGPGSGSRDRYEDDPLAPRDGAIRGGRDPRGSLFGQITIYTLLEDRVDDFDRLAERVVEQVRAQEPGTLAYIVHAVPTAPLQRILYEVYQDRDAYTEHLSRPYVARYDAERRRFVLATNVIELGLQQAKVSPFPTFSAISDILSESGIDLTGVTKSRGTRQYESGGQDSGSELDDRGRGDGGRFDDRGRPGHEGWGDLRREDSRYQ